MIHHCHSHIHHTNGNSFNEKMPTTLEHIQALEEERRKIQVFQRELPLCLQLVTQAIEECKQRLLGKEAECNFPGQAQCSEETSTEGPVLEEFIPLKRTSSSDDDDEQQSHNLETDSIKDNNNNGLLEASKKSDWLRSAQLWNQASDPPPAKRDCPKRVSVLEVKRNGSGGAFHPFKREKNVGTSDGPLPPTVAGNGSSGPTAAASSTAETGGGGGGRSKKEEREGQSEKKIRRCWSPELHKKFLQALEQLGGSNVATPKQIRELMKEDGLTNDEIKSHLQKYRLHNKRPSPPPTHNHHPQQPQFVVVGGIWVPPPKYPAMAKTNTPGDQANGCTTSNGIYAPIATLAAPCHDALAPTLSRSVGQDSHRSGGGVYSNNSPASSSSRDTTTNSNY